MMKQSILKTANGRRNSLW